MYFYSARLMYFCSAVDRLGLDLDPKARRPEDQHVVLVSKSEK
jgi:hypothetical protein